MSHSSGPRFHWFLPTGGDDSRLDQSSHGVGIRDHRSEAERTAAVTSSTHREATLEYLSQVAGAAEDLGFESVLTPTGGHCQDAWLVTAALIARTRRLKFMVALRPGLVAPALSAQMVATFQQLSRGRLLLNVVAGGSAAEQRGYGDFADKDERYQRAEEFLEVLRLALTGSTYSHLGKHFQIEDGRLNDVPDRVPDVYLGGSSPAAIEVTARQADVFLTWGEPPERVAAKLAAVRARGRPGGPGGPVRHPVARDHPGHGRAGLVRRRGGIDEFILSGYPHLEEMPTGSPRACSAGSRRAEHHARTWALGQYGYMTKLTGQQIADEALDGWANLLGGLQTRLHTKDFATGLAVVDAIGAAAEQLNHHPDLDLRYTHVDVRLSSHDVGGVSDRDIRLARTVTSIATDAGVELDRTVAKLELALDTPALTSILPFWAAVLAAQTPDGSGPEDEVRDPSGVLPTVWFQNSGDEEPRQRWHPDLWVDPSEVQPRIDAAVAAGGTLVSDTEAPSFWVLADPEGNKICLCTWQDRT